MRETSIEAYNLIKENGLLSKRRWQVYECLYKHGPISQTEAAVYIIGNQDHSITPRFAELERRGVIRTVGKRPCTVTGHTVYIWDVTKNVPTEEPKVKKIKCTHCNGKGYT